MLAPTELRANPVELLERQAASRVPELAPIRYGRMLVSPFSFYRGAALIMAADLAGTPNSGLRAQLCGDAHMSNFGVFASPERHLVFDANDFDETAPGPFEWDIKRLAASLEIAGREIGFKAKQRRGVVVAAVTGYREAMRKFAEGSHLAVWYAHLDLEAEMKSIRPLLAPGRAKGTMPPWPKRAPKTVHSVREACGCRGWRSPDRERPAADCSCDRALARRGCFGIVDQLRNVIAAYRESLPADRRHLLEEYRFVDMARKVVGVGSVGTRAWILLMEGIDSGDPLFLQAKEAQASVLEEFAGASMYSNHGQRVVAGQHLMQGVSDIFLGWQRTTGFDGVDRDFYVRQLRDWKGSADPEAMIPSGMSIYAGLCGWTLARAHARSGDRVAIASYLGGKSTSTKPLPTSPVRTRT